MIRGPGVAPERSNPLSRPSPSNPARGFSPLASHRPDLPPRPSGLPFRKGGGPPSHRTS